MITKTKARQLRKYIEVASTFLTDTEALEAVELFPNWAVGVNVGYGVRRRYNGILYRCKQAHTTQADWTPDIATSLWDEVAEPGQGDTPDNPIPYNNNMELFEGKYYSQYGVVYICFRSTGTTVYNDLQYLVGIYVNVYEDS